MSTTRVHVQESTNTVQSFKFVGANYCELRIFCLNNIMIPKYSICNVLNKPT